MADHVFEVGHPGGNHLPPGGKGTKLPSSLRTKRWTVSFSAAARSTRYWWPQGKGVGVHDDGGGAARPPGLLQLSAEGGKAIASVFQEREGTLHPSNFVKAQIPENLALRVLV